MLERLDRERLQQRDGLLQRRRDVGLDRLVLQEVAHERLELVRIGAAQVLDVILLRHRNVAANDRRHQVEKVDEVPDLVVVDLGSHRLLERRRVRQVDKVPHDLVASERHGRERRLELGAHECRAVLHETREILQLKAQIRATIGSSLEGRRQCRGM